MRLELVEFVASDTGIKRETGILRNVPVLSVRSKNRRVYTADAMRKAVKLYEGAKVYLDHPSEIDKSRGGRSTTDRFGTLENVRFVDDGRGPQVRADMRFLASHPMAERIAEDMGRGLGCFGLSHLGGGEGQVQKDGTQLVEEITTVREVDIVSAPGCLSLSEQATSDTAATGRKPDRDSYPASGTASDKARWLHNRK